MDMPYEGGSRKRKGRRTRKSAGSSETEVTTAGPVVEKAPSPATASAPAPAPATAAKTPTVKPAAPTVILAPPKNKPVRVLLVPSKAVAPVKKVAVTRKTYTAKCIRVTIDNTAKTQKRRRQTMQRIDALTDDQVRQACLDAKLSRKETVGKVPIALLRQMLKDYQTMRGSLL